MAKTATATPGKTNFLKEFLHDNPRGNVKEVNEAWQRAGFEGKISPSLVNRTRRELGLTRNRRGRRGGGAGDARKESGQAPAAGERRRVGRPRGGRGDRHSALLGVEAEIDRLIYTVMGIDGLDEVASALRKARRLVYGVMST